MYREVLNELAEWMEKADRKPLMLVGAKGVGKTWVVKDFGEGFFDNYVILDLKKQEFVKYLFEDDFNGERVIKMLSVSCGTRVEPGKTLIILENVDTVKNVERLLDFFCEDMKQFHICMTTACVESYGINKGYIEKLELIHMYPLSFNEFLRVNKEAELCKAIENNNKSPLTESSIKALNDYLRLYMYIGGMPQAVSCWLETQNLSRVREVQRSILEEYENVFKTIEDKAFSKKVQQIWASMGQQLLKENKKFLYGTVKVTARAREYGDAVAYLIANNYVNVVNRLAEPKAPAENYADVRSFELFMPDIGLLTSVLDLEYEALSSFKEKKDYMIALVEQLVYQELTYNKSVGKLYYWISDATAKVEFLFEDSGIVIPVEINLDNNTKAQSIKVYKQRYNPHMIIKVTENTFSMNKGTMELPLFAIWNL